jgi:hypothetical protein
VGLGIHPLVKVFAAGEEVGNGVGVSGDVIEHKIEILQEFHPSGLPASDLLWLTEVLEVFMICSNVDGMVGAEEVGAAAFESIYNGSHLFIVDVVVSFSW